MSMEPIDVVWLKKDIRLHDHGPLSLVAQSSHRQCIILYLYEPDQLSEKTVHGSHIEFNNEGLVDLDLRLSGKYSTASTSIYTHSFQCITVCYSGAAFTLQTIHKQRPINQIICHLETGNGKSFARDKAVRRWCRANNVTITELDQTGVTRCLKNRDDFTKNFNRFLDQPLWQTPSASQLQTLRESRLITPQGGLIKLHGLCNKPLNPSEIHQIPVEHKADRKERQYGGETKALSTLHSFFTQRGYGYFAGISSPNTSWTSCSRLSPYLTWGNISLRYAIVMTKRKQAELRAAKQRDKKAPPNPWLKSLASFQSRMHWRSHFIQKLESQPSIEEQDQCQSFSHLRRQPGDFNEQFYEAWCKGQTGFPFVDACMRCLIHCGWINFRMRAMLVSFATYNLWLDWKKIAGHLARLFLDYEPGIHYPQLQMQAGTTGINAMRVYNVTKQGQDQDPDGVFIKRYVPELKNVPTTYIHEPYKLTASLQKMYGVVIEGKKSRNCPDVLTTFARPVRVDEAAAATCKHKYPYPIVDEKATAKAAKDKLSAVRKQQATKEEAQKVYVKHGSRRNRSEDRNGAVLRAPRSSSKRLKSDNGQISLLASFEKLQSKSAIELPNAVEIDISNDHSSMAKLIGITQDISTPQNASASTITRQILSQQSSGSPQKQHSISSFFATSTRFEDESKDSLQWSCNACTFLNVKPHALACEVCGSIRS